MELKQAILERRSIRKYKANPVSDSQVKAIMEAARWAPSWANTQCTRFVVIRDTLTKNQLADIIKESRNPAAEAVRTAPVVIAACAQLKASGYYKGEVRTDKGDWFMFDVALALQNLTLAAHEQGLGTVHIGLFDAPKAAKVLGLPHDAALVELLPLGYPDEHPDPRPRKELSEIVFYEKYGQSK